MSIYPPAERYQKPRGRDRTHRAAPRCEAAANSVRNDVQAEGSCVTAYPVVDGRNRRRADVPIEKQNRAQVDRIKRADRFEREATAHVGQDVIVEFENQRLRLQPSEEPAGVGEPPGRSARLGMSAGEIAVTLEQREDGSGKDIGPIDPARQGHVTFQGAVQDGTGLQIQAISHG